VPYVAVVGDSYTLAADAYYAPAPAPTWPVYVAQRLGWRIVQTNANPGAGFLAPGASGTFLDMLRAQPLPHDADIVLVQGGLNDAAYDPARVPAAVDAVLDLVHLQAPRATVIVIGAFQPFVDRLVAPTQLAVARAVGSPAAIGSDRYLAGYLLGYEVLPDAVHPTARGHEQIGTWVGERLIRGLDSGAPLRLAPSGDYYIP
jgi:lysophospholipase L1-like esterase